MKGDYLPYQLSFNASVGHVLWLLVGLSYSSPRAIPGQGYAVRIQTNA